MADAAILQEFVNLFQAGYFPSVGAWVQVDPANGLTTIMNAFNTLGNQNVKLYCFDQAGNTIATSDVDILTNHTLRLDIEDIIPADALPFEGSIWTWARGDTNEGSIGLQAIDLDFIDRSRPAGYVMGSVHLIYDFVDTLSIPPYMDLVSPRLIVDQTPEGGPAYQNFLGVAHVLTASIDFAGPELAITMTNEAGDIMAANQTIVVPMLGSWFGDVQVLFPEMVEFLAGAGGTRGYGTINVRENNSAWKGLTGMVKVVDVVNGSMLVGHLNDRSFARPAMKEED